MIANKNAWHAKLYKFTYKSELPKNLCPYFWKFVASVILYIPNLIMQLPMLIVLLFDKDNTNTKCNERRLYSGVIYLCTAILLIYGFVTFHWIKMVFNCYSYNVGAATGGGIIHLFLFGVAMFSLFDHIKTSMSSKKEEEKTPNLIVEFVKAKYNKYCPQIEWKETK